MESVQEAIIRVGKTWNPGVYAEMEALYQPLQAAQEAGHGTVVTATKALKYGPGDRHRIDVYCPNKRSEPLPVVVFYHGGAFVVGDNDVTPNLHGNIANYFARNGCIGCLATYRLVPEAKFPNGADDVAASLRWVQQNIAAYGGDPARVFAFGQSAGGAHLASSLFLGQLSGAPPLLKGAVVLSASLTFDLGLEPRRKATESYFDTKDHAEILDKSSVGLFRKLETELPCDVLLLLAEYDFDEIVDANLALVAEWRKKFGKLPALEVLKGHNHISSVFGIGLEGHLLGPRILDYVRSF